MMVSTIDLFYPSSSTSGAWNSFESHTIGNSIPKNAVVTLASIDLTIDEAPYSGNELTVKLLEVLHSIKQFYDLLEHKDGVQSCLVSRANKILKVLVLESFLNPLDISFNLIILDEATVCILKEVIPEIFNLFFKKLQLFEAMSERLILDIVITLTSIQSQCHARIKEMKMINSTEYLFPTEVIRGYSSAQELLSECSLLLLMNFTPSALQKLRSQWVILDVGISSAESLRYPSHTSFREASFSSSRNFGQAEGMLAMKDIYKNVTPKSSHTRYSYRSESSQHTKPVQATLKTGSKPNIISGTSKSKKATIRIFGLSFCSNPPYIKCN